LRPLHLEEHGTCNSTRILWASASCERGEKQISIVRVTLIPGIASPLCNTERSGAHVVIFLRNAILSDGAARCAATFDYRISPLTRNYADSDRDIARITRLFFPTIIGLFNMRGRVARLRAVATITATKGL